MMAENSKIEWTDHTFNPWMGCTKVSDGCKFCYAERDMDHRYHKVKWGPQGKRVRTAVNYWKQPSKWNKTLFVQCDVCGLRQVLNEHGRCPGCEHPMVATMKPVRQRVFCASLADVFELKEDQIEEMDQWRSDFWKLIEQTPNLDWLLLTKRPENIETMIPDEWFGFRTMPKNIWWGFSAENQKEFDARVPIMESFSRRHFQCYFVSIEPMLGPIDIRDWLDEEDLGDEDASMWSSPIDWVICGGESGPNARPMNPEWARSLRDQCQEAGIPFFFKQWGEWIPLKESQLDPGITFKGKPIRMGDDMLFRLGKYRAGRFGRYLDGQEWMEFPAPTPALPQISDNERRSI